MAQNPPESEDPRYLGEQLITYIGNKRALLSLVQEGVELVRGRLGKTRLSVFDAFSGSGVTARFFKRFAERLLVNDLEHYAHIVNRCYLTNRDEVDLDKLRGLHQTLCKEIQDNLSEWKNAETPGNGFPGFISELYAPRDDCNIQPGERVFFTTRNAHFIDVARKSIGRLPRELQAFFLGPLLTEVSIHANTAGVFKGFYKNRETGVGQFGGKKNDALPRILGDISVPFPLFSTFHSNIEYYREDANALAGTLPEVDMAYLDPPYNQHPYGSNYFMLNLVADYVRPEHISRVSGIPNNWQRSDYNSSRLAEAAFQDLVGKLRARFVVVSFNSEGFIGRESMQALLERHGKIQVFERKYNAFRGSRNLSGRAKHVNEYLYVLEKR